MSVTEHYFLAGGGMEGEVFSDTVYNAQPTADFTFGINANDDTITAGLANATDPSGADQAAGLRFSFALSPEGLKENWQDASTTSTATFNYSPGTVVYGRVLDKDDGYSDFSSAEAVFPTLNSPAIAPNGVTLTWLDVTGGDVYNWRIRRSSDGGQTFTWVKTLPAADRSYVDDTVTPGQSYIYILRAIGGANYVGQTPFSLGLDVDVPPPAPVSVAANNNAQGHRHVTVNWSVPTGSASQYQGFVVRAYAAGEILTTDSVPVATAVVNNANARNFTFTDSFLAQAAYQFTVGGEGDGGAESPESEPDSNEPFTGWSWTGSDPVGGETTVVYGPNYDSNNPAFYHDGDKVTINKRGLREHSEIQMDLTFYVAPDNPENNIPLYPPDMKVTAKLNGRDMPVNFVGSHIHIGISPQFPFEGETSIKDGSPRLRLVVDVKLPAGWHIEADALILLNLLVPSPGGGGGSGGGTGGNTGGGPKPPPQPPTPEEPPEDPSGTSNTNLVNLQWEDGGYASAYRTLSDLSARTSNVYGISRKFSNGTIDRTDGIAPWEESLFMGVNDGFTEWNMDANDVPLPNNLPDAVDGERLGGTMAMAWVFMHSTELDAGDGTLTLDYDSSKLKLWRPNPNVEIDNEPWAVLPSGTSITVAQYTAFMSLVVEGLDHGYDLHDQQITATFSRGVAGACSDNIRATVLQTDVDVDSDNDNGTDNPDRSEYEDQIEKPNWSPLAGYPGKILMVGDEELTPIVFELPEPADPDTARVYIMYDATHVKLWDDPYEITPGAYDWVDLASSGRTLTLGMQALDSGTSTVWFKLLDADGPLGSAPPLMVQDAVDVQVRLPKTVDLIVDNLANDDKIEDGVGGMILLNGDNDNGSAVADKVATTKDYQITTLTQNEAGEMVRMQLKLPPPGENEQRKVRLTWNSAKARVWAFANKSAAALTSGIEWTLGQQLSRVYVEGIELSNAQSEITFKLVLLDAAGNELGDDIVKQAVGPILTELKATPTANVQPGLNEAQNEIWAVGAVDNTQAATLSVAAKAAGANRLVFVQNVKLVNNLAGGKGADLGGNVFKTMDFAGAAGQTLLDVDNDQVTARPLYLRNYEANRDGTAYRATATDAPRLTMQGITPNANASTKVDVTYQYTLHAAWQFADGTLYFLGKTTWDIRYHGDMDFQGANLVYTPLAGNGIHEGAGFQKTQDRPVLTGTIAYSAGSAWR